MENSLPKNWVEINLKESVDFRKGKKPKILSEISFKDSVPYMDIQALEKDYISFYADNESAKYFKEDDVVIVWDGSRSGLILKPKEGAIGSTLGALSPYGYKSKYLYYFLLSHYETINSKARGVGIPHVDPTYLWNLNLPLPPLAEQERIVAKLDKVFGQLELMKTALARIPKLLKDFRQQVLTQAVTGKLTEEWRQGKDLEEIEFEELIRDAELKILDFSKINESWRVTALGNFANCSRGKFTPRPRNDPKFFGGKYPFMQIGDLPREGGITYSYSKTLNDLGKNVSKSFEKNTVVIAIVGATIGNTGLLNEMMYFPDSLIGINASNLESNQFIEYFLRTCKYDIREISYSSGGQPNINTETIKNLEIAIPPLEEQKEIVSRVESLFAKADMIEARYTNLKKKIDSLPQAILHKAFKGELVPQLPTDGDAKDLLAEILALKSETKKKKK